MLRDIGRWRQLLGGMNPSCLDGCIGELSTVLHELVGRLLDRVCKRGAERCQGFRVKSLQRMLWALLLAEYFT